MARLYVGWVFFLRWRENRAIVDKAATKKKAEDQRAGELLGGNRFEILSFYASPGVIRRGETSPLCYGVANAKTVRLEPQDHSV
jgi:hypothetical protein